MILGMDWMEENKVRLDCGKKTVSMSVPNRGDLVHVCETPGDSVDRKSTRLNSSHSGESRMPSSA